jgi:lipopolysaccharide transport system ATP-binding protein
MSSELAISVNNVSKAYTIWRDPAARLKHPLLNLAGELFPPLRKKIDTKLHGLCSEFYALRDISFEVKKGESVGIIGRNGSGKSTLLQIIAGTLQPTQGSVTVHGRVAALLELGSGFNPEFTGRENVYLNASILGLTREETDARFAKIEAFADIGDFINQPVKTYSSGMVVRLAFAVQSMVDPDILIIDEALNVGDYFFQQKCARRMRELREVGTTLLFVSHDMASVRDLCQKALYLKKGEAACWGESGEAISYYFNEKNHEPQNQCITSELLEEQKEISNRFINQNTLKEYLEQLRTTAIWSLAVTEIPQNQEGVILGVTIYNQEGIAGGKMKIGEKVKIKVTFLPLLNKKCHIVIEFKNRYDQLVNSSSTYLSTSQYIKTSSESITEIGFEFDFNIEAGEYSYQVILAEEDAIFNRFKRINQTPWIGPLKIDWDHETQKPPFLGMFGLPVKIDEIKMNHY